MLIGEAGPPDPHQGVLCCVDRLLTQPEMQITLRAKSGSRFLSAAAGQTVEPRAFPLITLCTIRF